MTESPPRQLLFDFFDGKSTAPQKQWLATWLNDPANHPLYYECLDEWEGRHTQYRPDLERALVRFRQAVHEKPGNRLTRDPPDDPAPTRSLRPVWLWAAACLLLLLATTYLNRDRLLYQTYRTAFGETRPIRLDDGSSVVLNANSRLWLPRWGFNTGVRRVYLDGEAEFTVTHVQNHRPFLVQTSTAFAVEVLGTEFVLYARDRRRRVVLNRGRVKVTYQPGKQLLMQPGDWVTLNETGTLRRHRTTQPTRFASWKEHRFVFDQTSLYEVGQLIQEHFGLRVTIVDRALGQRQLSGVFQADKADDLLNALRDLLHIQVLKTRTGVEFISPPPRT